MASFYIFTITNKNSIAYNEDVKYDYKISKKISNHFITGYMYIKDDDINEDLYHCHNLCKVILDIKDIIIMIDNLKEDNKFHELGINPFHSENITISNSPPNYEMPYISVTANPRISIFKYKIYVNSDSYNNTLQYLISLFLVYHSIKCKKYTINNTDIYCLQGFVFTDNMHHDIIKTLDRYRYKKITTIFNRFKVYELISAFENDWKTSSNISDVFTKFIVDAKKLNLL